MSCRTQGWISICQYVCPSIRSPPLKASQASNSHWITWKIDKMQTSHWITWKINEKAKNVCFPLYNMENWKKTENNVKFLLNNMVNWQEIEEMQISHWISWIIAQDVWKFSPVSYRTSALWGRCPALTSLLQLITPSRASGTADH